MAGPGCPGWCLGPGSPLWGAQLTGPLWKGGELLGSWASVTPRTLSVWRLSHLPPTKISRFAWDPQREGEGPAQGHLLLFQTPGRPSPRGPSSRTHPLRHVSVCMFIVASPNVPKLVFRVWQLLRMVHWTTPPGVHIYELPCACAGGLGCNFDKRREKL